MIEKTIKTKQNIGPKYIILFQVWAILLIIQVLMYGPFSQQNLTN